MHGSFQVEVDSNEDERPDTYQHPFSLVEQHKTKMVGKTKSDYLQTKVDEEEDKSHKLKEVSKFD